MQATANSRLAPLYPAHLDTVRARFDDALAATGYDAVIIGAGAQRHYFLDDQAAPFRTNPHLLQWLPLQQHAESALVYRPGETPRLLIFRPDDVWTAPPELPGEPWGEHFAIETLPTLEAVARELAPLAAGAAYLGDPTQWRHDPPAADRNPAALLAFLHYWRPLRTPYEIECIRIATQRAVPAHRAAAQAFHAGSSEYEIWLAFLAACRHTENELPYPAIIAQNEHAAVLHYQHLDREPGARRSLLIDAGCNGNGYASDISRTHSAGDPDFTALIDAMDDLQQRLAARVAPGIPFGDLHAAAHAEIGKLLQTAGIVDAAVADPVADGITAAFFPHGLGHFLGLQVHEVGGDLADTAGNALARADGFPNLRLVRTLEPGQVLTIEPGLYFIDALLNDLRTGPAGGAIDWQRVAHLQPFGGIRIEDNVLVTATGHENLTRRAFDAA